MEIQRLPTTSLDVLKALHSLSASSSKDILLSTTALPGNLTVSCWVFNEDFSKILLVNHPKFGWTMLGGHVHTDESPLQAAKRELAEESGLILSPLGKGPILGIQTILIPNSALYCLAYYFTTSQEIELQPEQNRPLKWVKIEDIPTDFFPLDRQRVAQYLQAG